METKDWVTKETECIENVRKIIDDAAKEMGEYKYLLSILCMFDEKDAYYLDDHMKSLPDWCEIIYMRTLGNGDAIEGYCNIVETKENLVFLDYHYDGSRPFHFSHAMNVMKSIAKGKYVFKLDADERLLIHQHKDFKEHIEKIENKADFGGMNFYIVGTNTELLINTSEQTRLIPNTSQYGWEGGGHETVNRSIRANEKKVYRTNLVIHHSGYEIDNEKRREKMIRNIKSMLLEPVLILSDEDQLRLLIRDCYNYQLTGEIK